MNTRRSFFQRLAGAVAAVALAPEIAFRAKLELPKIIGHDPGPTTMTAAFWTQTTRWGFVVTDDYVKAMQAVQAAALDIKLGVTSTRSISKHFFGRA